MKHVEEFYEKTNKINKPSALLQMFFNMNLDNNLKEKIAIELGAGVGNDVKLLVDKGFKVTCVDKEEKSRRIIEEKIKDKKINFVLEEFESVKLHKADLIFSNYSLHFCRPEKFERLMNEITKNIVKDGYFLREFYRK